MITVRTQDAGNGIWIEVSGHTIDLMIPVPDLEALDKYRVCAAVSALMATLGFILESPTICQDKDLDGLGYLKLYVSKERLGYLKFVLAGITIISMAYPGTIRMDRKDSKLLLNEVIDNAGRGALDA
jgi:uncharacterized protein YsxB (DUF464 family)